MKREDNNWNKVTQSILIGTPRVILTFGAGHPFDLLKTRMQADPHISSAVLLTKKIFQETGIRGFYVAGIPNLTRSIIKETYRSPLRGFLASLYDEALPNANKGSKATITSLSMAVTDTFLITPLERIKVWLMTKYSHNKSFNDFFSQRKSDISWGQHLFKGASISMVRSSISWSTFLVPETMIRDAVVRHSPRVLDKNNPQLPFAEKLLIGSLGGVINGLCTLPFDTVKTNVQKEGYLEKAGLKEMMKIGKDLVAEHGIIKGLYPAFSVRLLHYSIVGIITSDVIQKVDQVWKKQITPK